LNGLYINLKGREPHGAVSAADRDRVAEEIASRLVATIDPQTGTKAITRVFRREQVYKLAGFEDIAPDMIVGYAKGTRSSDESALGGLAAEVFENNTTPWTGDHCMDPEAVPGVLFTSRRLARRASTLQELPGAILAELGISGFPQVRGN
jgi:predicted AlkP superfamily phosphohydrolase/phosphomutase